MIKQFEKHVENNNGFSKRQETISLVTRDLYHMAGVPTLRNLNMAIRQNIIQNLPVTVEDIDIAEKIFGPNVSTLKVRTTRKSPKVVVDDFIEIPRKLIENNQELIMCMDFVFINKNALFTTIKIYTRF